jgi:two-component system sensor histidine kinase KdpD
VDVLMATAISALVSSAAHMAGLNAATAALVLHTAVLFLAAWRGFAAGLAASLMATASFSFFLDPTGSWRIDALTNWIALASFLIASTVTSRLVSRARHQAAVAEARRSELAALYRLSVELFTTTSEKERGVNAALALSLGALQARGGGVVSVAPAGPIQVERWSGVTDDALEARCRAAVSRGVPMEFAATDKANSVYAPQESEAGTRRIFVAIETPATTRAIESAGALLALESEHERALAASAHAEALRESHELKTSLLRAVSHDLNTPLTAVSLQLGALERELAGDSRAIGRIASLREDTAVLRRRIENLLGMARLEAGVLVPHPEPVSVPDLFLGLRKHMEMAAAERPLRLHLDDDCPEIDGDPSLLLEVLVNLVDNAHRASPPAEAVDVGAARHGAQVRITVADRGAGLPAMATTDDAVPIEDLPSRGLGLEIARTFTAASGGTLVLMTREGGGTIARLELPAWSETPTEAEESP